MEFCFGATVDTNDVRRDMDEGRTYASTGSFV